MKKINVDIIGTCYSRELFNTTDEYKVKTYLMRQSIFTMFSKPLPIDENDVKILDDYNFKKRMVYFEFNKLALSTLFDQPSEYLIIDLLNEIRDFYDFKNPQDVKIVSTKETTLTLKELRNYFDYIYFLIEIQKLPENEIRKYFQVFIEELLKHYNSNRIILNKVQMQNFYYQDNKKIYITDNFVYSRKKFVKKLENLFLELLPTCKVLETTHDPILDINHRLGGPHPVHFEQIYYKYRMDILNDIIHNGNNIQKLDNEYLNLLNKSEATIKSKKLIK